MIKPQSLGGLDEARDSEGNVIIIEYKLPELFPLQVQPM